MSSEESKPISYGHLGETKSGIPSPLGVFGKLALVVGIFSIMALGFKKFWKEKAEKSNALFGAIGKFARTSLGVRVSGPKIGIEVLANHHFGPKKSIAVVKIGVRTLVIGITEQSINLISQLSTEEDAMNALAELDSPPLDDKGPILNVSPAQSGGSAWPTSFAKQLQGAESVAPTPEKKTDVRVTSYGNGGAATGNASYSSQAALGLSSVRAQIKSKLEGLKQI